jgi:RNA polymerase sigma-32 factor
MTTDTDPKSDSKVLEPEVLDPEVLEPEVLEPEVLDDDDDPLAEGGALDEADAFIAGTAHRESDPPKPRKPRFAMPRPPPSRLPARRDRSLAAADPLRAYMAEVSRYALLTPEEEHDLAVDLQVHGDPDAAYKLVTANLRLVAKIAFKYRRFYKNVLDLIQEGNIGLMKAVQKFDPYRGVRLSTYARYWIQAYIMYFLLANHRMVKVGTTQAKRKLFYNLTKETKRLRDLGFDPTPQRIADSLNVDVKDVIEMKQRLATPDASLDAPMGADDDRTRGDMLPGTDLPTDVQVENAEMLHLVGGAMRAFGEGLTTERERILWDERLMTESPKTLEEIGQGFGVTRERTRQIEAKLKKKLKKYLLDTLGQEVELSIELVS